MAQWANLGHHVVELDKCQYFIYLYFNCYVFVSEFLNFDPGGAGGPARIFGPVFKFATLGFFEALKFLRSGFPLSREI